MRNATCVETQTSKVLTQVNLLSIPYTVVHIVTIIQDSKKFNPYFQKCKIKFGSWTYNGHQLDVESDHPNGTGDTTKFLKSGEWDLTEFKVKRNTEVYACCPEFYPDVTFTLLIKRRTRYYYINMLLPNMFITGENDWTDK